MERPEEMPPPVGWGDFARGGWPYPEDRALAMEARRALGVPEREPPPPPPPGTLGELAGEAPVEPPAEAPSAAPRPPRGDGERERARGLILPYPLL